MKRMETITLDEVKEYSDAGIQSELSTHSISMQTDPEPRVLTASFSVQTEELVVSAMSIQTDPEPVLERPRAFCHITLTRWAGPDFVNFPKFSVSSFIPAPS